MTNEIGDLALIEGAVGNLHLLFERFQDSRPPLCRSHRRLLVLRDGRAHLGRDALTRREIQTARALELGLRARDAALVAVEDRQPDVDARPHLEPLGAFGRWRRAPP